MALDKEKLDTTFKVALKDELDTIFGKAPSEGDGHRKEVCDAMSKAMSEVILQHLLDNLEVVGIKTEVPGGTYLKGASGGGGATGNITGTVVIGEPEDASLDFSQFLEPEETLELNGQRLVVGKVYTITRVGDTDFTALGASENKVGVKFTATATGGGTATVSSMARSHIK